MTPHLISLEYYVSPEFKYFLSQINILFRDALKYVIFDVHKLRLENISESRPFAHIENFSNDFDKTFPKNHNVKDLTYQIITILLLLTKCVRVWAHCDRKIIFNLNFRFCLRREHNTKNQRLWKHFPRNALSNLIRMLYAR